MEGGAKLGEGAHGAAYDLCLTDNESFCHMVDELSMKKVTLYTYNEVKLIEPSEFVNLVHRKGKFFAKLFKPKGLFSLSSARKEFLAEIRSNRLISQVLEPEMLTFHVDELGAHIEGSKEMYVIFGKKCDNKYVVKNIKKFVKDILESLVVLNKEYLHNDIKDDNIVKCGTKFKLIDWGGATSVNSPISRTSKTTSPIKIYLEYGFACIPRRVFTRNVYPDIKSKPEFKEQTARIMSEFEYEVSSYYKKDLVNKFHGTHDVFQLGMTMLILILKHDLDYEKFKPLIEKLTSLKEPLTAKQAISLF
jgi:serine/threonine protein kinase